MAEVEVGLAAVIQDVNLAVLVGRHGARVHVEVGIEFLEADGESPLFQKGAQGRDHNPAGFTCWLAGAGVKKGFSYGATDEFGYRAVENVVTVYDLHATILHLLGLEHERLTYYHNGLERRLTDVHGHVVRGILA